MERDIDVDASGGSTDFLQTPRSETEEEEEEEEKKVSIRLEPNYKF